MLLARGRAGVGRHHKQYTRWGERGRESLVLQAAIGVTRPHGPPPPSSKKLKYAPVYDRTVYALLDEDKRLKWNVNNTLACIVFGPRRGRWLRQCVIGGKYGLLKMMGVVAVCVVALVNVCLRLFHVDEATLQSPLRLALLYVTTTFAYGMGFIVFFFFFDVKVARVCAFRRFSFWVQVIAAIGLSFILVDM